MTMETVFSWLGQLVAAGGGGAVIAFLVFKYMGENWVQHQLAKDLELAKSEISLLAARKLKLHDQEYVVFPEVWAKLNSAVAALGAAVSLMQELPDLDRMSEEQYRKWLDRSDLDDHEKTFLAEAATKNNAYGKILNWRQLHRAWKETYEFRTHFREKRIFIDPDIKEKLEKIDSLLHSIWVDRKMSLEEFAGKDRHKFWTDAWKEYNDKVQPAMVEIEYLFQKKLFPNTINNEKAST